VGPVHLLGAGTEIQANVASGPFTGRHGSDFGYGLSAQGVVTRIRKRQESIIQINGGTGIGATFCAIR